MGDRPLNTSGNRIWNSDRVSRLRLSHDFNWCDALLLGGVADNGPSQTKTMTYRALLSEVLSRNWLRALLVCVIGGCAYGVGLRTVVES